MKKNQKLIWISLILVFVSIFFINFVFAIGSYDQRVYSVNTKYSTTSTTSLHSGSCTQDNYKTYCSSGRNYVNTIHYTQYGTQESRRGFLGDYVKEYSVYVTNRGKTGRYFTVTFELEDKDRQEFTQSITQYLRTGEKKRFVYRDIQYERNEILNWGYRIIPQR